MRAEEIRNIMNTSKAMDYIIRAAQNGKSYANIPKEYVNRRELEDKGYKVTGGTHQLSEECKVSWEKHWRD